jgi:exopolyphosphatase/guanosine-5'-triphosphate,3'-diphosphate pyrophosphatase
MSSQKKYFAVIDIGSNSMRLVIYFQQHSGRLHEVENVKAVARLRNYINDDKNLSDEGIYKLIRTLKSFKEVVSNYELTEFKIVATAAVRQARNNQEIKKIVKEELDWEMRILSEYEEAFYGYLAVVNSTTINEGITVDIGGGSTEVTYFKNRILRHSYSFPFGALNLKDFFDNKKTNVKNIQKLRRFLQQSFHSIDWLPNKYVPLIGIGGSARNMVQIDQNLKRYPLAGLHQYEMNDSDMAQIIHYLASLSPEELSNVDGLSSDRADTILPAIILFHSLYLAINSDKFILSRKGLRDGVFYEDLSENSNINLYPNVLEDSLTELINEYDLEPARIEQTKKLTEQLFNGFKTYGIGSLTKKDWELLYLACHVYNLGNYIDSESSSQHTFYLLSNRTIDGLMHTDRLKMSLIASYKSKTTFKQYIRPYKQWFIKEERKKLALLGAMLKFTYSLDDTNRQTVQDLKLTLKKDQTINLTFYCDKDFLPEQYQAEKQKKHLEKLLKKSIRLLFVMKNNNQAK